MATCDLPTPVAANPSTTALQQQALWRHRGTLVSGGLPTWRG
jgi:hypothetical protein